MYYIFALIHLVHFVHSYIYWEQTRQEQPLRTSCRICWIVLINLYHWKQTKTLFILVPALDIHFFKQEENNCIMEVWSSVNLYSTQLHQNTWCTLHAALQRVTGRGRCSSKLTDEVPKFRADVGLKYHHFLHITQSGYKYQEPLCYIKHWQMSNDKI